MHGYWGGLHLQKFQGAHTSWFPCPVTSCWLFIPHIFWIFLVPLLLCCSKGCQLPHICSAIASGMCYRATSKAVQYKSTNKTINLSVMWEKTRQCENSHDGSHWSPSSILFLIVGSWMPEPWWFGGAGEGQGLQLSSSLTIHDHISCWLIRVGVQQHPEETTTTPCRLECETKTWKMFSGEGVGWRSAIKKNH